jgi:hypothetical protein
VILAKRKRKTKNNQSSLVSRQGRLNVLSMECA